MKRKVIFEGSAFDNFNEWAKVDKKLYAKIVELIKDIDRAPFTGLGKPEPLKYEFSGFLTVIVISRRGSSSPSITMCKRQIHQGQAQSIDIGERTSPRRVR